VSATVAIVWPCPLSVEEYQAAGRGVGVPRTDCPDCGQPMVFWSGYQRYVRVGRVWRVWVARAKCRPCRVTHALLPSFALLRRLDVVWVIGAALERVAAGVGLRPMAAGLGVPHTTVRGWWRRFGVRAPVLVAGLCALVVELGGLVGDLPGVPECAALAALEALAAGVGQRLGGAAPATWPLAAIVSGGGWLGATTNPPRAGRGGRRWLPPEPRPPPS
jgi:transposase-like protein